MNQFHWTYWDNLGRQHIVGILHGIKTGHLVIHLNSRVLIIDFNVLQSKTYSFLINEEICELQIEEQASGFKYDLGVNEAQELARKEKKKKEEKKFLYQQIGAVILTSIFLFSIALSIYLIRY